jgi:predicted O-methyltransferase YrrM
MLNDESITIPQYYQQIKSESEALGFNMLSDLKTGSLLRTLSASKPNGRFLELGTGTGLSLVWIVEGADENSSIHSVDNSDTWQSIARKVFDHDHRINFYCTDGNEWLKNYSGEQFDLIFADAWPGKFENLDKALQLVKTGGFYLIDDLLPQPNWPQGHQQNVDSLVDELTKRSDLYKPLLTGRQA